MGLLDKLKNIKKPTMNQVLLGSVFINPVAGVAAITVNEIQKNPDGFKNTLRSVGSEIKKDLPVIASTLGSGVKSFSSGVGGVFNKLMLPLIVAGAVVLIVLLKK